MNSDRHRIPSFDKSALGLCMLGVVIGVSGCGHNSEAPLRGGVSGQVTLDGEPLASGVIRFVPIEGAEGPKCTVPVQDGQFQVSAQSGPLVGEHRVEIEATDGELEMNDELAFEQIQQNPRQMRLATVPETFNKRSQLEAVILPGDDNELTYHLASDGSVR